MKTCSVKDLRKNLGEVLRAAQTGSVTVVTRYGKPVAQISPVASQRARFPDMSAFRASLHPRGESLTDTLLALRDEERA
jgi:prevent-host-death family protein